MIFQCDDLERALRTPELMPDARAHAEQCPNCREQLYLWSEISRLAPQLHEEWESPALWPRIHQALAAEPVRRAWPRVWQWALAVAAMVTLAVVLLTPRASAPARRELLSDAALLLNVPPSETHAKVEHWLTQLHSPTGLDLGADSPETIALSVIAEIQKSHTAATALPLRTLRKQPPADSDD